LLERTRKCAIRYCTARAALGSTNSDNANQLGNKLTTGISNQLKNQAINKTEGLVNDKANKFLNAFELLRVINRKSIKRKCD
jgi:hypothetical protein